MKCYLISMVVILAALVPTTGCEKRKAGKTRLGEVERLPRVETIVLGKPAKLEVVRTYLATVESLEKAELCAMVKGYVKDLPPDLDIGKTAKKGELLIALYVPDLVADHANKTALVEQSEKAEASALQAIEVAMADRKETEAAVLRYEAEADFRRMQHARISKLTLADTLSRQQLDEAKLQLDTATAALEAAKAQVTTKEARLQAARKERDLAAARVKSARTDEAKAGVQVEFAGLRAPFDGVVTKRWVDTGTTVKDSSMPLLTFMRTDKVRVLLDVPERDVPYLRAGAKGNPVRITIPALRESGDDAFAGNVTLVAEALDPITRTMRSEVHLDNKVGDKLGILRPQMTGTAYVILASRDAFTVPSSALVRVGDKMEIFIVADAAGDPLKGTLKRVEVQTGIDDGFRVEVKSVDIKSEHLTGRELVVAKGAGVLRAGDQVIAVTAKAGE